MRIPTAVSALALLLSSVAFAQRGVGGDDPGAPTGVRRAVIVGVSKYPPLPPNKQLEYASADARYFYEFLISSAGGSIPAENLQLLIDEQATSDNILNALAWLRLKSQPGDEAIIYFAGHGDVETLTGEEGGFLLASNVRPAIYGSGGAIDIDYLAKFVRGIVTKGASVLLITDACRSGKLVGDPKGAERTTAALLQTWDKVAKIVSSAPEQVSFEGKQWGGGHGAFTYFLINGLKGLADSNNDGRVTLQEMATYVNENVEKETGKQQSPQSNGDTRRLLARVDTAVRRATQIAMDTRKPATDIPKPLVQVADARVAGKRGNASTEADTALTMTLASFHSFLGSGALLEPAGASAWDAYQRLSKMPQASGMMPDIKYALAGALRTSAQTVVFDYLAGGNSPPSAERLRRAARELTKALELFGADYELSTPLRAQLRFLEGYAYVRAQRSGQAIQPLKESIALDPKGAYAYNALGFAYLALDSIADARRAFVAAKERAPRWSYPSYGIGLLDAREGRTAEAERQFQQAIKDDAGYVEPRRDLASLYTATKRPADAERVLLEAWRMDTSNVKTRADLGAFYQEQGRHADAIRVLERVVVLDPTSVEPYIRLSISYFYSDRAEDAIRMANRAIGVDGKSAWAYRVLGYYSKSLKRYEDAERSYRRAAELSPSWANVANDLGAVLITLGRLSEAEAELRRAEKLPNSADIQPDIQDNLGRLLEKQSRMDQAELSFRRALALDSLNSYRYDVLAGFYYRQNRFTEAEPAYRRAVELDPQSARLAGLLGSTYQKLGRPAEAVPMYLKAATLDSLNSDRYNDLGVAAYEMATQGLRSASVAEQNKVRTSSYEAALAAFRRAAELMPSSALYAGNVGVTYKQLGRLAESEREYKRSIALDSLNSERYTNLASLYVDHKRYTDAEALYRKAAMLDPKSATIARSYGFTFRELNDTASAIREYLRALSLDSLNYSRHTDVGIIYYWASRLEEARAAFARAAELGPQSALNAQNLGLALYALHKSADAEREYLRAIKLDPTYADAYNSLGFLYSEQGKVREAEANWRAALKLQPGNAPALNNVAWVLYGRGELTEAARLSEQSLADSSITIEDRRTYLDTRANIALDSGDARGALAMWERNIAGNAKPDPVFYLGRAMSLLELGREAEAVAAYRQAVSVDSKYGDHGFLAKTAGYSPKALARLDRLKALAQSGH